MKLSYIFLCILILSLCLQRYIWKIYIYIQIKLFVLLTDVRDFLMDNMKSLLYYGVRKQQNVYGKMLQQVEKKLCFGLGSFRFGIAA